MKGDADGLMWLAGGGVALDRWVIVNSVCLGPCVYGLAILACRLRIDRWAGR